MEFQIRFRIRGRRDDEAGGLVYIQSGKSDRAGCRSGRHRDYPASADGRLAVVGCSGHIDIQVGDPFADVIEIVSIQVVVGDTDAEGWAGLASSEILCHQLWTDSAI